MNQPKSDRCGRERSAPAFSHNWLPKVGYHPDGDPRGSWKLLARTPSLAERRGVDILTN
jgi:hypothetical protein